MIMAQGKITKRAVDAIQAGTADQFLWDTDLKGFGLKTTTAGKKMYIIQYRHSNRLRRYTIGAHGVLTPEQARKEAIDLLAKVANGEDPAE
uniref:Arm DNA-binding domain-containing protein n=1 Tax=Candidatus Magnetaquicoccus inordinatus TaxID=2496818 RepID=UPI001D0E7009